jgi:hypothetical protein
MPRFLKFDPGASFAPTHPILDQAFGNPSSSFALLSGFVTGSIRVVSAP